MTAVPARTRAHRRAAGDADLRLRWWALPLPLTVFLALLALVTLGGEAHAGTADGVGRVAAALWELLSGLGAG
ncbi:hypothetical protein WDH52_18480 [Streptomyces sp. TRM70308]|uniref:hypothetical protein n=1 Tax=Streptomyces TaxID=1883 RepID=UPI0022498760|nr:hypothetical protein [Streptomyces sp. JHD 1]MCX2971288.1 hypothetical protein [Streptomyces sp. JHD 1]